MLQGRARPPMELQLLAGLRCSAYCSSAVVSSAADLQPPMAFQRHQYGRIDRAAWLSPPLRVRRSAFAASCSALEKSSSRCSTWLLIDLVVLFNKDRPPMPRLQRLAEHSEDSCQLNSRCGVSVSFLAQPSRRLPRAPTGPVCRDRGLSIQFTLKSLREA